MTNDIDLDWVKLSTNQLSRLYKRHRQGAIVRTGASLFMWLFAFFAYLIDGIQKNHLIGVSFCVGYLILINPPTLWILKHITRVKIYQNISVLINFLEVIGYTAVIYSVGGVTSLHITPIYCALIAYVGTVGPSGLPFTIATLSSAALGLMVGLEFFEYIPHQYPSRVQFLPNIYQLTIVTANISLLYVMAFIISYTGGLLRKNKKRLREQNTELERSRAELKMAAEKLEGKNIDLKMAFDKARESDRMKSEFLANRSHELRTPLNHIIDFTELVADKKFGNLNKVQEEYLNDALHSSKHLLSLINDVLDLSKVEAGKLELQLSDVNLNMILENSLTMVKEQTLKRGVHLSTDIDGIPEIIRADERKLKQVMYNLLSNAVKFSSDGGEVCISGRRVDCIVRSGLGWGDRKNIRIMAHGSEGRETADVRLKKCIEISITDSGIGMETDALERIFDPFEKVEQSASRRFQGTGLGLPITRSFVELHGGSIWA